jgi:hypothetical protein
MKALIISEFKDTPYSLIIRRNVDNGHDCWGNYDYTTEYFVKINGKEECVWENCKIIHDNEQVYGVHYVFLTQEYALAEAYINYSKAKQLKLDI